VFLLLPLQVEDAAVDRLPIVSIGIAAICALAFLFTWVLPSESRTVEEDFKTLTHYYAEHPYLMLPPELSSRLLSDQSRERLETLHEKAAGRPVPGGAAQQEKEQAYVDGLASSIVGEIDANPLRRFALVPARGLSQPGWITHLFLHFGWMHLLGNLLFFYIAGPLLEDVWGRLFFACFYVLGGVISGAAQVRIEHGSAVAIAGASGAIAACMGAFSYRYAARKVRMGYFFWFFVRIFRGTFLLPAWLWGASWFAVEVFDYASGGGHSGVAVMAHIGGFLFGAGVAFVVGLSGFERKTLQPRVERGVVFRDTDPLVRAREAVEARDFATAANEYRRLLYARPGDREALLGLTRAELHTGQQARALGRLDKLLQELLGRGANQEAWDAIGKVSADLEARGLAQRTARMLLAAADYAPAGLFLGLANQLNEAARKEAPADAAPAPPPVKAAPPPVKAAVAPAKPAAAVAVSAANVRITPCKLIAITAEAVELATLAGQRRSVPLARIAGLGAAMVPAPDGARSLILTDLVFRFASAEAPAALARFSGPDLMLGVHFRGLAPRDAYRRLLAVFLAVPGIVALPARDALEAGNYPLFADEAALNASFYGA
jgi:membrane associated rhomboid family serine protease